MGKIIVKTKRNKVDFKVINALIILLLGLSQE